jgi:alanine racemase
MAIKLDRRGLRTWIEIDKKAIAHNYGVLRKLVPKNTRIMSVVKSNAYGHGLVDFALEGQKLGVDFFGVDSIVEAIALRKSGIKKPILVLGFTLPEMLTIAVEKNISITVSTFELLDFTSKKSFKNKIKVHIKVDTGMRRQGFQEHEIEKVITKLKNLKSKVQIEGLFTHFAGVKNSIFKDATNKQLESFKLWINRFSQEKFTPIVHAGASSVTLAFPVAFFDMVRIGIALYGLWPSKEVEKFSKIKLKPILEWKTIIGEIKKVKKGSRIGYDFTEEIKKDSTIAVCPIGYWHGYPRNLSGTGFVLVHGKRARVLGRVSMDMIVIDISPISSVKVGDSVTLLGRDGREVISPEEMANWAGTSSYEIVTRINPLIKRIYF